MVFKIRYPIKNLAAEFLHPKNKTTSRFIQKKKKGREKVWSDISQEKITKPYKPMKNVQNY